MLRPVPPSTVKSPHTQALDERWYPLFVQCGSFQAYEYLDGDRSAREAQKRAFLLGEVHNPSLDYPLLQAEKITWWITDLSTLQQSIIAEEPHEVVKQAYVWKINEKIAEARLLLATLQGDDLAFQKYTEYIYGKPSLAIYTANLTVMHALVMRFLEISAPQVQDAAQQCVRLLPTVPASALAQQFPTSSLMGVVREHVAQELWLVLDDPIWSADEELCSAEVIHDAFVGALQRLEITDWQVVIDAQNKSAISVNHENKIIHIPAMRKVSPKKLKKLIAHEIGTHVLRRVQGENSLLKLLGLWLDRYERGEEGIATMKEQLFDDMWSTFAWIDKHLAISLVYGLDGQKRDFRALYDFFFPYYFCLQYMDELLPDDAIALTKAQDQAWSLCVRIFRGTKGTSGICFTKDIIYGEGNAGIWDMMIDTPGVFTDFSLGKYDPMNPRHKRILENLWLLSGSPVS